jgi:ubiquinone/menaquinone biosynthesis C-methylase UbiE
MEQDFIRRYGDLDEWHWWFRGRRRILETILDRELGRGVPRTVVSVGCGPVRRLGWLRPYAGGGHITGLDFELENGAGRLPGTSFVRGSAETLPFADATVDLLIAADVLEHLRHDGMAVAEIVRVMRRGGLVVITVPALPSLWGSQDVVSHHYRRYTKGTLRELLAPALPQARLQYFNTLLFPPVAATRWLRRVLGSSDRVRSDFDGAAPGFANEALATVFAAERVLVTRVPLPIGVSLLAIARTAAN